MNILIVDDDHFVLKGIKKGIDWNEKIGRAHV